MDFAGHPVYVSLYQDGIKFYSWFAIRRILPCVTECDVNLLHEPLLVVIFIMRQLWGKKWSPINMCKVCFNYFKHKPHNYIPLTKNICYYSCSLRLRCCKIQARWEIQQNSCILFGILHWPLSQLVWNTLTIELCHVLHFHLFCYQDLSCTNGKFKKKYKVMQHQWRQSNCTSIPICTFPCSSKLDLPVR